ncbi:hypothetical protein CH282_15310 [Rhodococcus sp. 06-418-1B]|nr:hypothetical protein [Rhodococcus sp. 06-418-1B]OZC84503.1 hypothetical protein CH282_15310 [Rhodococcus sp. 06-418-1B]
MHQNNTVDVLSVISTFSNREFGPADVTAWHLILKDLDFQQALDAVAYHHKVSAYPIKPYDIVEHIRSKSNDLISRANAKQHFRDQLDASRDDRVAELVGGDRRSLGTGERGNPAGVTTRHRVVTEISEKFGRRSDIAKVQALGNLADLTIDTVMQKLGGKRERWDRARATKALHAAHCIARGEEPPTATYVRPERRVVPLSKKDRKTLERRSKADAEQHLAYRGFNVAAAFTRAGAA